MGAFFLRDARVEDLPNLCALRDAPSQHEAKLRDAAAGHAHFLVAVEAGAVVAFATVFLAHPIGGKPKSHIPKLSDCYVRREHRSRGIGQALVHAREERARGAGHDVLYVSVDPIENPRWRDFFLRRGYTPLQAEPYRKTEVRHDEAGRRHEILVWRLDLMRRFETDSREEP